MRIGTMHVGILADMRGFRSAMGNLPNIAGRKGSMAGDVFAGAFGAHLGVDLFYGIMRGFQMVTQEAINFNAMLEQSQIAFTTIFNTGRQQATQFLGTLEDFAVMTPFEYPDVIRLTRQLSAAGFEGDQVIPIMRALGDATAAIGGGRENLDSVVYAIAQMKAKGKIYTEEMSRQLGARGIPAWEVLAEAVGKSVPELQALAREGKLTSDKYLMPLIIGLGKRFEGLMEELEDSWIGVTAALKDLWRGTLGHLTRELFNAVRNWLVPFRDWWIDVYLVLKEFGSWAAIVYAFGPKFAAGFQIVAQILKDLWWIVSQIGQGFIWIAKTFYWLIVPALSLAKAFYIVTGAMMVFKWAAGWKAFFTKILAMSLYDLAIATGTYTGMMGWLVKMLHAYKFAVAQAVVATGAKIGVLLKLKIAIKTLLGLMGPKGWAVLAVGAGIAAGVTLWGRSLLKAHQANMRNLQGLIKQNKTLEKTEEGTLNAADSTDKLTDAQKKAAKRANDNIQAFDQVHQIVEQTAGAADDMAGGLGDLDIGALAANVPDLSEAILPEMEKFCMPPGFWQGIWDSIKRTFWIAVDKIKNIRGLLGDIFDGMVQKIPGTNISLRDVFSGMLRMIPIVGPALSGIFDILTNRVPGTGISLTGIFSNLVARIPIIGPKLATIFNPIRNQTPREGINLAGLFTNILRAVPMVGPKLATVFTVLRKAIPSWAETRQWGINLINGIVDGLRASRNPIIRAGGWLAGALSRFFEPKSPPKEGPLSTLDKWGPGLVKLYADSLIGSTSLIKNASTKIAEALAPPPMTLPTVAAPKLIGQQANIELQLVAAVQTVMQEMGLTAEREVVLNIDGQRIARAIMPSLVHENQRTGTNRPAQVGIL